MIKLFKVGSFAYTPFVDKRDLEYLKKSGLEITEDIKQADILVSQNFKHLKKYFLRYFRKKKFLVWTLEPRFDLCFYPSRKILLGLQRCHFMNIYTKDVYTSINPFRKRTNNKLNFLRDNFDLSNRRIVALMSYFKGVDSSPIIFNNINIDLVALRTTIAIKGFNRNVLDIYGKGWPDNISIEDSRGHGWPNRKEEILKNYNFNLCFENTIAKNYVSEKIWDSIGSYCLPIFYGKGSNIYSVFPRRSFIDYSEFQNPDELFNYVKNMKESEFMDRLNKCIHTYMKYYGESNKVTWMRKKDSLNKIIEKCRMITS